jgi:hypothetical protein
VREPGEYVSGQVCAAGCDAVALMTEVLLLRVPQISAFNAHIRRPYINGRRHLLRGGNRKPITQPVTSAYWLMDQAAEKDRLFGWGGELIATKTDAGVQSVCAEVAKWLTEFMWIAGFAWPHELSLECIECQGHLQPWVKLDESTIDRLPFTADTVSNGTVFYLHRLDGGRVGGVQLWLQCAPCIFRFEFGFVDRMAWKFMAPESGDNRSRQPVNHVPYTGDFVWSWWDSQISRIGAVQRRPSAVQQNPKLENDSSVGSKSKNDSNVQYSIDPISASRDTAVCMALKGPISACRGPVGAPRGRCSRRAASGGGDGGTSGGCGGTADGWLGLGRTSNLQGSKRCIGATRSTTSPPVGLPSAWFKTRMRFVHQAAEACRLTTDDRWITPPYRNPSIWNEQLWLATLVRFVHELLRGESTDPTPALENIGYIFESVPIWPHTRYPPQQ